MTDSPPQKTFLQRHGPALLVSVCLGGGLAWVLARGGFPVFPGRAAFTEVRPWAVVLYVVSLGVVHFFRAVRWRFLLRPLGDVPPKRVVAISWIAFAAILLSPFRTGEVVRPYLLAAKSRIRLWEAAGTVGAERVVDGFVLSVLLLTGLLAGTPISPLPDHVGDLPVPAAAVRPAAYLALAIFSCAFLAMGLFYAQRERAQRWTNSIVGVVSPQLATRLSGIAIRLADGLRFLPSRRLVVPFLGETMVYWAANALGLWMLARGCGLSSVSLADATVVMGCIGIGILVPSGPGYFGAFQLAAFMALATTVPEAQIRGPGAAFVFIVYAAQTGFHIAAAAAALALDPVLKSDAFSEHTDDAHPRPSLREVRPSQIARYRELREGEPSPALVQADSTRSEPRTTP